MKKIDNSRKNRLLAVLMAMMMSSSIVAMAACDNSTSNDDEGDDTSTETIVDNYPVKNANFEQDYEDEDGLILIGSDVDHWTRSLASGCSDSSKSASGIVDTKDKAWNNITQTAFDDDTDVTTLTEEQAEALWSSMSAWDKLTYYKAWEDDEDNEDSSLSDLSFYQKFTNDSSTLDIEDMPTVQNPRTHDYVDGEELGEEAKTKILMIHNNYSSTYYKNRGLAQRYTSSSTITVQAGTSVNFSVWVKTMDLTVAKTNGEEGGQPAVDAGAYISVTPTVGGNTLDAWKVENINTEGVTTNNGWLQYTFYLRGSYFADTTFSLELGLGQANDNYSGYVNGYAFFDDITCETILNSTFTSETSSVETLTLNSKEKMTWQADNKTNQTFALDLYGESYQADTTLLPSNIKGAYTTESNTLGDKFTSVDVSTVTDSALVENLHSLGNLSFNGKWDVMKSFADISKMNDTGNPHLQSAYDSYVKDSKLFKDASIFDQSANKELLMLLSSDGAAIKATSSKTYSLEKGGYLMISFFVKTSNNFKGVTSAQVTLVDGNTKTSISGLDTTDITTVDIGDTQKDIYDGWQQCFFFVKNETDKTDPITFTLEFNLGPTTILDQSASSFKKGFAMFTGFKTHVMSKEEYACAESGTYAATVSLTDTTAQKENTGSFDTAAVVSSPNKNIENNYTDTKNYTGVYGGTAAVGGATANISAENVNAGLLNRKYAEAYDSNGILTKLGASASATTADEKWKSVFGSTSGLETDIANQPLVIYSAKDSAYAQYSYGFVGKTTSISANASTPTIVSLRVKVSAGAKAYVYLIDTDEGSYTKELSVSAKRTYWYDESGNVCISDPTEEGFKEKTDVAFFRRSNGLYQANKNCKTASIAALDEKAYYYNLLAYDTVKNGNLMVAEGGVSYDYKDDWQHEGNDGVAFYGYDENAKTAYADKAKTVQVFDFSTVADLPTRTNEQESKQLYQVVDGDANGTGWVNVTFYIQTGATAKNYRLEVWSGARDNSVVNPEGSYVIFDTNGYNSISSDQFNTLLDDAKKEIDKNGEKGSYFESVFSFYDSALFLRYNDDESLNENKVGDLYENYKSTDYDEDVVYLTYTNELTNSLETFVDYSVIDKTVEPDDDDADDDDTDDDSDGDSESDTNVWLLVSSIAMAAVLILAVISLVVRKIVANIRKKRGYSAITKANRKGRKK